MVVTGGEEGVLLTTSGQRPAMLPNLPQSTEQPLTTQNYSTPGSVG